MAIDILLVISRIIFIIVAIYSTYFIITGWLGITLKNKVVFKSTKKNNKFAILIPARNEESVISNLIDSLKKQNYPNNKYVIYVIPNNCTDKTKDIAKKSGANVLECTVPTKTKGDVLKFAFDKLKKEKSIDAYVIFDADNVVHPDFLKKMNECLEAGYNCAEGFRDAKNPSDNWLSGSYNLFYLYQNIFFNRARGSFNASCSINGTGFMVRKSYIEKVGFETYTLTEDIEFTGQCALRHEPIAFVEDAITFDEYPIKFGASWRQRKRWSAGSLECRKRYSWKLFKDFIKTGRMSSFDMSIVYWGPIILILNFFNILVRIGLVLFHYPGVTMWLILIAYLVTELLQVFMLLYKKKKILPVLPGIILFPLFIYTWVPINCLCLVKKQTKWEQINHNRNVDINKLIK